MLGPLRLDDRTAGDVDRVADAVARLGRERRDTGALADHLELGHRVGALEVAGDQHRRVALLLEPQRELSGQCRLTGTLQTGEHDHRRRVLRQAQPPRLAAEDRDELLVDDLDDLLGRVERLMDLGAFRPFLDPRDERLDHAEGDVGFQQRDPDFARGGVDVGVGQPALARERLEGGGEPIGEGVEHGCARSSWVEKRRAGRTRPVRG